MILYSYKCQNKNCHYEFEIERQTYERLYPVFCPKCNAEAFFRLKPLIYENLEQVVNNIKEND